MLPSCARHVSGRRYIFKLIYGKEKALLLFIKYSLTLQNYSKDGRRHISMHSLWSKKTNKHKILCSRTWQLQNNNKEGTSLYSHSQKRLWKPHLCLKSRQHKDSIQLLKGSFYLILCALLVKRGDYIIICVHKSYGTSLLSLNRCSQGLDLLLFFKSVEGLGLVLRHPITAIFSQTQVGTEIKLTLSR